MRVVLGLLLVLLGLCGSAAQEEGFTKVGEIGEFLETTPRDTVDESIERTTNQTNPDILEELRAMRVELSLLQSNNSDFQTRLSSSESELLVSKSRIDQLEKENAVQATRLTATEAKTSNLEGQITDLQTRLSSSENELLVSKSKIDQLEKENAVQETRLTATEGKTSNLEGEITDLQTRLSSSESELLVSKSRIDQLEKENAEKPKVAFYTALIDLGQVGPFNTDVILKYSKVFTNIGNAYSPSTGFFTAPVKGVYYFQFTAASFTTGLSGVFVFKNNERIMYNGKWNDGSYFNYFTNSVVLELIAGDTIHLGLPANDYLFDGTDNHCTFSGALLFPL